MPDTYSTNEGLILMEEGTHSNEWGDLTNLNLRRLDVAARGYIAINLTGALNLTANDITAVTDTPEENGFYQFIEFTGTANTVTTPDIDVVWHVYNNTDGNLTFQPTTGTGVTLTQGKFHIIIRGSSGNDFVDVSNILIGVPAAASDTVAGIVELATIAETNTGTDATRAVTPDGLEGWTGSSNITTLGTLSTLTVSGTAGINDLNVTTNIDAATATFTGQTNVNNRFDQSQAVSGAGDAIYQRLFDSTGSDVFSIHRDNVAIGWRIAQGAVSDSITYIFFPDGSNQTIQVNDGAGALVEVIHAGGGQTIAGALTVSDALTVSGQLNLAAGTTAIASLNIPEGVSKTSPVDGDMWITTTDAFIRINGVSESILASGAPSTPGGSDTQIQYNNGGSLGGIAGFTYADGATTSAQFAVTPLAGLTSGDLLSVTSNLTGKTGIMTYMRQLHASSTAKAVQFEQFGSAECLIVRAENTQTATPVMQIEQGSTGDCMLTFDIGAIASYSMGMDNSDSDKFKIGVGGDLTTDTVITIDDTGGIMNLKPPGSNVSTGITMTDVAGDPSIIIGNGASDKIGFFNTSAVIQQQTTGTATGFTAGAGTGVNDDSTFTGGTGATAYRISDIVLALKNYGLLLA